MKQIRAGNFATPRDAWLLMWPHEWDALNGLPAWATRLFLVLVSCADFKTGNGRTGYSELINRLTPDQPERGPRLWAPTRDDVKAMLQRFEKLLIVARDKNASEARGAIVFHVAPRGREAAPAKKLPPKLSPGSTEGEGPKLSPETPPVLSEKNSYPLPPEAPKLSTAEPINVPGIIEELRRRRGRGTPSNGPPKGA